MSVWKGSGKSVAHTLEPLLAQYWRGSGAFSALNAVTDKTPFSVCSEFGSFDRPRCSAAAVGGVRHVRRGSELGALFGLSDTVPG